MNYDFDKQETKGKSTSVKDLMVIQFIFFNTYLLNILLITSSIKISQGRLGNAKGCCNAKTRSHNV